MIIRIFIGPSWAEALPRGDYDFYETPRIGEGIAIGEGDLWLAGRILDVAHRLADGTSADVALLIPALAQVRRGEEDLPGVLLDQATDPNAGNIERFTVRSRPWG